MHLILQCSCYKMWLVYNCLEWPQSRVSWMDNSIASHSSLARLEWTIIHRGYSFIACMLICIDGTTDQEKYFVFGWEDSDSSRELWISGSTWVCVLIADQLLLCMSWDHFTYILANVNIAIAITWNCIYFVYHGDGIFAILNVQEAIWPLQQ